MKIGEVKFNECVPNELFIDYVEQMKYLAMRDTSAIAKEKRNAILKIENKVNEARKLLEEYRLKYGYRNRNYNNRK
ncbi:MAG: hypothetical protein SVW57_15025 [Thermodesulfobacteriota bacterium]|nr:hypothetical protein [Thermodesulfobacteriota bacterium]